MVFTIGLPITKTGHLSATINGILSQNFQDFEVIIKNNALDSKTKKEIKNICKPLLNLKNTIYLESKTHLPMADNFNSILEKANGDFFVIMSDDDVMESDFLSEFEKLIKKYPDLDVFHCRVKEIDENDNFIKLYENCPEIESRIDFLYNRINYKRSIYLSDFIVSTKSLKQIGGFPNETSAWGLDEITWIKLGEKGFAYTPKVLLNYRVFKGNISYNPKNMEKRFNDIDFMEREIEQIIKKESLKSDFIYPIDFLFDLNKKRTIRQKDDLFINFTKVSGTYDSLKFYLRNKNQISKKGFLKGLSRVFKLIK